MSATPNYEVPRHPAATINDASTTSWRIYSVRAAAVHLWYILTVAKKARKKKLPTRLFTLSTDRKKCDLPVFQQKRWCDGVDKGLKNNLTVRDWHYIVLASPDKLCISNRVADTLTDRCAVMALHWNVSTAQLFLHEKVDCVWND